jgi:hypothetical protein
MKKMVFLGLLAVSLVFIGCPDLGTEPEDGGGDGSLFSITFNEVKWTEWDEATQSEIEKGWNEPGNEGWGRWNYEYQDTNKLFDLSSALTQNKVYVIKYTFKSDIDINELNFYFRDNNSYTNISKYQNIRNNIKKNTKYSGQIAVFPDSDADGVNPEDIILNFIVGNRDVSTPPTLSFYEFSWEVVDKEDNGLDKWTISETEFDIDKEGTFAEEMSTFSGKNNVLHLRPAYNLDSYGDNLLQYDLEDYEGKEITITMSMDIYLKKAARIAWQINSRTPDYFPVVCGRVEHNPLHPSPNSGPAYTPNTWHHITGSYTLTVTTDNTGGWTNGGRLIYLSGMQIDGAEAYLANASISIQEGKVDKTMAFWEDGGWNSSEGNANNWDRWVYPEQDENTLFDLSTMLSEKKVYVLSYSFISDIDLTSLQVNFYNTDSGWTGISNYASVKSNIEKNTKYSGKVVIIPNEDAENCNPENTWIRFSIGNRTVSTAPTLYFSEYKLEQVEKEDSEEEWSIDDDFVIKINDGVLAEILDSFDSKSDVLYIKPAYGLDEYHNWAIMLYDLNSYRGQTIKITMSMDIYLTKSARVAWQINSTDPYYPVVCGVVPQNPDNPSAPNTGPAYTANTWHTITTEDGGFTYTVPDTDLSNDNGKKLYLSGMQLEDAEAYFANATITITEVP